MRLAVPALAVLAFLLVAGCAQPGKDAEGDPLFGLCPQWAQGHGGLTSSARLEGTATNANATNATEETNANPAASATSVLEPADALFLNRPLDLYRVRIEGLDLNGTLALRAAAADGMRLAIRDYRSMDIPLVPVVHLDARDVGKEFDVYLSPVLDESPAATAPARLEWTLEGTSAFVNFSVTYHYKVCGA